MKLGELDALRVIDQAASWTRVRRESQDRAAFWRLSSLLLK
jgi:hypothetical protein